MIKKSFPQQRGEEPGAIVAFFVEYLERAEEIDGGTLRTGAMNKGRDQVGKRDRDHIPRWGQAGPGGRRRQSITPTDAAQPQDDQGRHDQNSHQQNDHQPGTMPDMGKGQSRRSDIRGLGRVIKCINADLRIFLFILYPGIKQGNGDQLVTERRIIEVGKRLDVMEAIRNAVTDKTESRIDKRSLYQLQL